MDVVECQIIDTYALQSINVCKKCSRTLNVPPIYCIEYDNCRVDKICGRCYYVVCKHSDKKWRQYAYENIAQFLTYPCVFKNEGCESVLKWNEVLDHEALCSYSIIKCPARYNDFYIGAKCNWEGNPQHINNHLLHTHQDMFIDPPYLEEFSLNSKVYFTRACDTVFMIIVLCRTDDKYSCCILVKGSEMNAQLYRYQVELMDSTKTNSMILRRNKLENWINIESTLCNQDNLLDIDCDVINNLIQPNSTDKRISVRFGIVKKSKKEIRQIYEAAGKLYDYRDEAQPKITLPDDKLLIELECPVCNEFMVPPIYICSNGHSICCDCLQKLQSCPNCRCSLGSTRNFTLENLTTKVVYPCRNKEAGCNFVTTSENIREHENSCNLISIPCPLNCGSDYRKKKIWPHVAEKHSNMILEMGEIHQRDIHDKKESHYVVLTNGEVFRLAIKGSLNTNYKFSMQMMGEEKITKFKFTLEIIDNSPYKLNITTSSLIQQFNDSPFKTNTITFPWEMLKPFVPKNGRHFCFRYNISPVKFDKNAET